MEPTWFPLVARLADRRDVAVNSAEIRALQALRAPGGMTSDQVYARFPNYPSHALYRLKTAALVDMPSPGQKGNPIRLTKAGREAVDPAGPLARSKTLINYCHL